METRSFVFENGHRHRRNGQENGGKEEEA